jgi:hypothetical protein
MLLVGRKHITVVTCWWVAWSGCVFVSRHQIAAQITTAKKYSNGSVAARYETWVSGRSLAGTAGSNPAEGMDAWLL